MKLPITSVLGRYALAVAVVTIVSLVRLPMRGLHLPETPYLLYVAAVLVAAGIGGFGPGFLALILSVLAGNFFFSQPYYVLDFFTPAQRARTGLFFLEGIFISILGGLLRQARRRVEAAAVEARELQGKILSIADQERERIGRDLHDDLGQHLTGTALLGAALARRLQDGPERDSAQKIAALLEQAVGQTRDLAHGLAPVALTVQGLPAALAELAHNAQRLFIVTCRVDCDDDVVVTNPQVAMHLYRIAQEAVTNAAKHGGSTIAIRLFHLGSAIELAVTDNGNGISPEGRGEGMGMQIMAYRAHTIHAELSIESRRGRGTIVRCILSQGVANEQSKGPSGG